jgi:hypothetical protein
VSYIQKDKGPPGFAQNHIDLSESHKAGDSNRVLLV